MGTPTGGTLDLLIEVLPSTITGVGPGAIHHLQKHEKGLEFNDLAYRFASFGRAGSSKLSEKHSREEHERS